MSLIKRIKRIWALGDTRVPSQDNKGCDDVFVCSTQPIRKMAQIIKRKPVDPISEIIGENGEPNL